MDGYRAVAECVVRRLFEKLVAVVVSVLFVALVLFARPQNLIRSHTVPIGS